jgi:hypothetical protein
MHFSNGVAADSCQAPNLPPGIQFLTSIGAIVGCMCALPGVHRKVLPSQFLDLFVLAEESIPASAFSCQLRIQNKSMNL